MRKILQAKEKPARTTVQSGGVLRKVAAEVPLADIKTAKIKNILKEMSAALKSQDDGVALAAPQIGYSLRIFIVSRKILQSDLPAQGKSAAKDLVFINPKISKLSRERAWVPEGCLSVRWLYGKTIRAKKATIAAYDEKGKKFTRGASGLLAQIFQHETDHLQGILFIDHAKDIKEELPAK